MLMHFTYLKKPNVVLFLQIYIKSVVTIDVPFGPPEISLLKKKMNLVIVTNAVDFFVFIY